MDERAKGAVTARRSAVAVAALRGSDGGSVGRGRSRESESASASRWVCLAATLQYESVRA